MIGGARLAGHLGVRAPDLPLFRHLAGSGDPLAQIALLADLGFAGAADNFLTLRPAGSQTAIGEALARHGMEMGSFVHDPAHWDRPTWSAPDREALGAALAVSLEAAARSGSRTLNCITGLDPARDRPAQIACMADNLAWAGDRAAAYGVALCVEATHPAFAPGLLIERAAEALRLVERVDHPHVRLNVDIGHIAMHGDDVEAAIRAGVGRLGMVQAADAPGRIDPGAGRLDWPAILAGLQEAGYAGLIELEFEPMEPGVEGERALLARLERLIR